MSRLHEFERIIDDKLRSLFRGPSAPGEKRELIEVHRAILDDVAAHVESLPRRRRAFAYSNLTVRILLSSPERRRSYEVAFAEGDALARDMRARLEEEEVDLPEHFSVEIELVDELPPGIAERGFDISYAAAGRAQAGATVPTVWLHIENGRAERDEYSFRRNRINLGRLTDIVDSEQRLIRRNDVAFVESPDGPNTTVSRTHAHLEYEPASGQYRLFDDRSAQGTKVLREGTVLTVPRGLSKGVQLRSGDEIVLGQARVRFEMAGAADTA